MQECLRSYRHAHKSQNTLKYEGWRPQLYELCKESAVICGFLSPSKITAKTIILKKNKKNKKQLRPVYIFDELLI